MLKSLDLRLSDAVQAELLNYINVFRRAKNIELPVLVFPVNMGRIICKTIRYFAAIYSLAAFYVSSRGSRMLVVCQKDYLIYHYFTCYEDLFLLTNEDTEVIDYLHLHNSYIRSIRSLHSWRLREDLGLPLFEHLQRRKGWNKEKSLEAQNSEEQLLSQEGRKEDENVSGYANLNLISRKESSELSHSGSSNERSISTVHNSVTTLPDSDIISNGGNKLNPNATDFVPSTTETAVSLVEPPSSVESETPSNETYLFSSLPPTQTSTTNILMEYFDYTEGMAKYLKGPPLIVNANQNYDPYEYIRNSNLDNVVEVYDIPMSFKTSDLVEIYGCVLLRVKWCDDSHALIITTSAIDAKKVMAIKHASCSTRSMLHGSPVATVVASLIDFSLVVEAIILNE